MKKFLMIGQILKPQGVKGEIKVLPLTDDPERFCELEQIFLDENGQEMKKVLSGRTREGYAFLTLEGVADRDAAERLRDQMIYLDRSTVPPLPEGRYYICDLMGMKVLDEAGSALGTLCDVLQAGGNDVYEVKGARVFRFPALKRVLREVNVETETMVLDSAVLREIAVYDDED